MEQFDVDARIQRYYTSWFREGERLTERSAQGALEFERTQEIVRGATSAPARVLDVGGGTGVHATALASAGYDVTLVDPVPAHIEQARVVGAFDAVIGDARTLHFDDDTFDVVLLLGRCTTWSTEPTVCWRFRRRSGCADLAVWQHAAAIPRFAAFAAGVLRDGVVDRAPEDWLELIRSGTPVPSVRFPAGHFHTATELADEMTRSGLVDVAVIGLEGPASFGLEVCSVTRSEYEAASGLPQAFESHEMIREFSGHLLGTGSVSRCA